MNKNYTISIVKYFDTDRIQEIKITSKLYTNKFCIIYDGGHKEQYGFGKIANSIIKKAYKIINNHNNI